MEGLVTHDRVTVRSALGIGKCVNSSELIPLSNGSNKRAADLVGKSFELVSFAKDGTQEVSKAFATDNGLEEVFEIVTDSGRKVVRTGGHPFLAAKGRFVRDKKVGISGILPEVQGWVHLDKLSVGDLVAVPRHLIHEGNFRPDENLVKISACMIADGFLEGGSFTQSDGEVLNDFRSAVEGVGWKLEKIDKICYRTQKEGKVSPLRQFLREVGLLGLNSYTVKFPDFVWELPNDLLAIFLNRLFACDGWVHSKETESGRFHAEIGYCSMSEQLVRDVQSSLLRFGIVGDVRTRKASCNGKSFVVWEWVTRETESIVSFFTRVGIISKDDSIRRAVYTCFKRSGEKSQKWQRRNLPEGYQWDKIKSIRSLGVQHTVCISVPGNETFITTFVEHNSKVAAVAIIWGLHCHRDSIVVNTAPVFDQVEGIIWPEIHSMVQKARFKLPGELLQTEYRIAPKWRAFGRSTNQPERFAGIHASPIHDYEWELSDEQFWQRIEEDASKGGFLLLVIDEASGVEERIFEAAAGFMTTRGSKMLLTGNPTKPSGRFFESHKPLKWEDWEGDEKKRKAIEWKQFHVSSFDVMREAPRLYDPNYIERARHDWGEGTAMWQVRVLGEFPLEGPDILFPLHYLEQCRLRKFTIDGRALKGMEIDKDGSLITPLEFGIDIGAQGEGETVVYVRRGDFVDGFLAWREPNTMITIQKIKELILAMRPSVVRIDIGAFGKNVADNLSSMRGLDTTIVGIQFGGGAHDGRNYGCRRDEMFFEVAQKVRRGEISGIVDDITLAQLSDIRYAPNARDKIIVESKKEMEKRGRRSPDRADAFVLCFCTPNEGFSSVSLESRIETPKKGSLTGITLGGRSKW